MFSEAKTVTPALPAGRFGFYFVNYTPKIGNKIAVNTLVFMIK